MMFLHFKETFVSTTKLINLDEKKIETNYLDEYYL